MGPRVAQLLLLGILVMLLMDEGVRFCNECNHYDGFRCRTGMKSCWKINMLLKNRSCSTDVYYYSDRFTGRYLYRYTTMSCKPCEEGMFQVFHDLLRETFCCSNENRCNDGNANLDISSLLRQDERIQLEMNEANAK